MAGTFRWTRWLAVLVLAGTVIAAAIVFWRARTHDVSGNKIGLFTSLPILWPEADGVAGALPHDAPAHWALATIRGHGSVLPLDRLASDGGAQPLGGVGMIVIAQPRPLAPDENVALDQWVRGGGRMLLFADPMLTIHSRFPLGDPRRPQDTVLLSPILTRWGLRLEFDELQPVGERLADMAGVAAPINLAGRFVAADQGGRCSVMSSGLVARCVVGKGLVLAVADAALLEGADDRGDDRSQVLDRLIEMAGR